MYVLVGHSFICDVINPNENELLYSFEGSIISKSVNHLSPRTPFSCMAKSCENRLSEQQVKLNSANNTKVTLVFRL